MYSLPENLKITSSDKFYFTCPSYGFISPVLSLIDNIIAHNPEINIVVMENQMKIFWDQLMTNQSLNWNLIFLDTSPPGRYRNILSWFKIRPLIRKLFEDNFKSVENAYFYCCGTAIDLVLFSLVKLIETKNTVVFLDISYPDTQKFYSLKSLFLLIHTWLFYRLDVTVRRFDYKETPFVFLSERYFKKLDVQLHEFKYHYNAKLLQKYNPIPVRYTSGKKIVWLGDDGSSYGGKIQDQVLNRFREIKSIIDENFTKNETLFKAHPNPDFHAKYLASIYDDYEELPSFMNADFIISNPNIQFILGGNSAVLSTAAIHTNIIAISYLKLMPFQDQEIKDNLIEFLMQLSDRKILFVDSLEELNLLFQKPGGVWRAYNARL